MRRVLVLPPHDRTDCSSCRRTRRLQWTCLAHLEAVLGAARRYPVRMALIDLDAPPTWFASQAADFLSAAEARRLAGTDGAPCRPRTAAPAQPQQPLPSDSRTCHCRRRAAADQPGHGRLLPEPHQRVLLLRRRRRPCALHRRGDQHALGRARDLPLLAGRRVGAQGAARLALHGHGQHLASSPSVQPTASLRFQHG